MSDDSQIPVEHPSTVSSETPEHALGAQIRDWLGSPTHWWIEPTTLFQQSKVPVWGSDGAFPFDVRMDEFWAWGVKDGQVRALHGVRRNAEWRLRHQADFPADAEVRDNKVFELAEPGKRYASSVDENSTSSKLRLRIDSSAGRALLKPGE